MSKLDEAVSRCEEQLFAEGQEVRRAQIALDRIAQQYDLTRAKLEGLREAQRLVGEETATAPKVRKRRRGLSPVWRELLQIVEHLGKFNYDHLARAASIMKHEINRDTLRSQMSAYRQSGLVVSVDDGWFELTDEGRKAVGLEPKKVEAPDAETSEASEELGPVTGRERGYPPSTPEGSIPSGSTPSSPVSFDTDLDDDDPPSW